MRAADLKTRQALATAMREALGSHRSQAWLAARLEVDQTTVSQWLLAKTSPRLDRLPEIEAALGMTPGSLRRIAVGEDAASEDRGRYTTVPAQLGQTWGELDEQGRAELLAIAEALRETRRQFYM